MAEVWITGVQVLSRCCEDTVTERPVETFSIFESFGIAGYECNKCGQLCYVQDWEILGRYDHNFNWVGDDL